MSTFDPELADLDDPGVKLAIRGGRAGGTITGSPGGGGTLGGGGGSLASSVAGGAIGGAGSEAAAVRALLRKRMLTTTTAPSYLSATTPTATPPAAAAPAAGSSMSSLFDMASGRFRRPGATPGGLFPPGGQAATPPPNPGTWGGINESGSNVPSDVNFGSGFFGTLNDILRNYLGSGAFSDKVNPAIMEGVRRNALADADAARQRNALAAQALGADPATAASYALRSDLSSQGSVAKALSDASLGELTHQRDFGQNLLLALLGGQGTQNSAKGGTTALDQILKVLAATKP